MAAESLSHLKHLNPLDSSSKHIRQKSYKYASQSTGSCSPTKTLWHPVYTPLGQNLQHQHISAPFVLSGRKHLPYNTHSQASGTAAVLSLLTDLHLGLLLCCGEAVLLTFAHQPTLTCRFKIILRRHHHVLSSSQNPMGQPQKHLELPSSP